MSRVTGLSPSVELAFFNYRVEVTFIGTAREEGIHSPMSVGGSGSGSAEVERA